MPSRGEVWLVDLGLAAKTRPALILTAQGVTLPAPESPPEAYFAAIVM
jgi:hypothetical protein